MENKFLIQNKQYEFPYHYIPQFTENSYTMSRKMVWGGEYLAYQKFVINRIAKLDVKRILDVGCGDGRLCQLLHQCNQAWEIKGIDLSEDAIKWAKAFNKDISFETQDVADEKCQYDVVTAVEVIEHIPDEQLPNFFKNISKVLKNEGSFIVTVPFVNIPVSKKHYRHYSIELLRKQLEESGCGMEIVESEYIVPVMRKRDELLRKLMLNRFWKLECYEKFEWNRLWENGLICDKKHGAHCFAIIRKRV